MKNLPTNMIEKIKSYDRKSDYTRMTGIEDGEEETVIDLSVKPEMKKGWISNVDGGYGTEKRYTGRFMVNHFTDKLRVTGLGGANNLNQNGREAMKEAGIDFVWENGKKENEAGRLRVGGMHVITIVTRTNFPLPIPKHSFPQGRIVLFPIILAGHGRVIRM